MTRIMPIFEVTLTTAHSVRTLRACVRCNGLGHSWAMIGAQSPGLALVHYHPQCYKAARGFAAVLQLPRVERNKYRLSDLTIHQGRRLLALYKTEK